MVRLSMPYVQHEQVECLLSALGNGQMRQAVEGDRFARQTIALNHLG